MSVKAANKQRNPYQVLYLNPSMGAQKFAKMATKYHQEREMEILARISGLINRELVQSSRLNWRQRAKYSDWSFRIGRNTIYMIPEHTCVKSNLLSLEQDHVINA